MNFFLDINMNAPIANGSVIDIILAVNLLKMNIRLAAISGSPIYSGVVPISSRFVFSLSALEEVSIADKSVDIDGINIAYKDEGVGQVILCLHALGHSSKDFTSLYNLPLEKNK